jgi:diguanylate cyclase (GGDEF)-like protein/PAS domain S-box-containing protein
MPERHLTLEHRIAEREAEAAMAMELYYLLAENATDMVSTHLPDGNYSYATTSWADFLGVPIDEIIGHNPLEFAHPDDRALIAARYAHSLRSPEVVTTSWRCRRASSNGGTGYAWLETSARAIREPMTGRVQTFVCATRDVSERKRMEEELARSEARFRAALDGSFDSFLILEAARDANGHIVDFIYSEMNVRAEKLLGRSRGQVLGHRMSDVFPETAVRVVPKLASVVESGLPHEEEVEYRSDTHPSRWLHHQIVPLGDGVAITSRDITDRKVTEEELHALALVDDLTGLYNRRGFRMLAEQHLRLVKRGGPISLLVCFDLDGFKGVNDLYGHAEGDVALRQTANILRTAFRDSDIMGRFGGDEFVVLALDCGDLEDLLLGRVKAAVDAHNAAARKPYTLSLSMGTARLDPFALVGLDALMVEADANLYEAKRQRRSHTSDRAQAR